MGQLADPCDGASTFKGAAGVAAVGADKGDMGTAAEREVGMRLEGG